MSERRVADNFHAFTRRMWSEFKTAADYATGMSEPTRATFAPPLGFVREELGFGVDTSEKCGPACRCNAMHALPEAQVAKVQRKRRTGREWQRMLTAAS